MSHYSVQSALSLHEDEEGALPGGEDTPDRQQRKVTKVVAKEELTLVLLPLLHS